MKSLFKFKARAIICISILLISIVNTVSAQGKKNAIIDAGSSGSRLWVYSVEVDADADADKINIIYTVKGPALSTIAPRESDIKAFLDTMTNKYNVNENGKSIPLYVFATAGMRMISQAKADSIYSEMNNMKDEKFGVFQLDTAMTISGQYEGLYAWISANYKAGKLEVKEKKLSIKTGGNTIGILEIGGASMQIAFAATEQCGVDTISREGLGKIYSKSYLHYGADRIFEQLGSFSTPNCLVSLNKIDGLYDKSTEKFVGLSMPIKIVFQDNNEYSDIKRDFTKINEDRKNDRYGNYHPATNTMYIDWVVYQLSLGGKLYKQEKEKSSDWTEGAALDIMINDLKPESFNYNKPN